MTDLDLVKHAMTMIALTLSFALVALASLKGWNGWLALKRAELDMAASRAAPRAPTPDAPLAGGLIEMADLKERIRKLEAIAAGIDV
ncbi:hypothetical protein M2337_000402 [Sphingobium sp. B2D3A]|uniref:hypothetical protein n=1 Tax=unclassified Sphingobium TaxID=2611147 RepID=UPI00222443BF|nr:MULTISPECIES: hypothetical protein [unclassified Sphingobium]MCW2336169.1 hypothetical protein [Sphingobium sp. B2D3A]MCW2371038.1 hypothetical protein [Sphingobium sp. B11D3D]MCW2383543.1 hypothetical protein [Sphingobium sp. B2D3B]MCW2385924.1 hypothetical protein [Sphingobium sp. B2D3D]MCW2399482.1 hypothetical protein [Sphingobium sp. B2D3C]